MSDSDPHRAWLNRLRHCRLEISGGESLASSSSTVPHLRQEATRLEREIATTEATTKDGLLSQAALLADLAWNETVSRLARTLVAGIKRLVP